MKKTLTIVMEFLLYIWKGTISGCWNPARDTTAYEFYCDPGKGCDGDVQFWYRVTPSPVGKGLLICLLRSRFLM